MKARVGMECFQHDVLAVKEAQCHLKEEREASQGCAPGMAVSIDEFEQIWRGSENGHRWAGTACCNEILAWPTVQGSLSMRAVSDAVTRMTGSLASGVKAGPD